PVRDCGDDFRIHAKAIDRRTGDSQWCNVVAKDSVVSLSVFSWEGVGWVIPFATTGSAGAAGRMGVQMLDLDGNNLLGKVGMTLGKNACSFGKNPVLGLRDSDKSFMLLWHDYESVSYVALRID